MIAKPFPVGHNFVYLGKLMKVAYYREEGEYDPAYLVASYWNARGDLCHHSFVPIEWENLKDDGPVL